MLTDYLYQSNIKADPHQAVIVLPEIYGLKEFAKELADKFAQELNFSGYALDYFWQLTRQPNNFDYQAGMARGVELMNQMTGADFLDVFGKAVDNIAAVQPELQRLVVVGFCFGGRLAYLSGVDRRVTDIISFYGAGSVDAGFYEGDSAVGATVHSRHDTNSLRVIGLFGEADESIPKQDRMSIKEQFEQAQLPIEIREYQAGHAFFNDDRPDRYVAEAAIAAWQDVKAWLRSK